MSRLSFGNYDQSMINIFDVIGSCFVNIFYNKTYNAAINRIDDKSHLAGEYSKLVEIYIMDVKKNDKTYNAILKLLYDYFKANTGNTLLTFSSFIDQGTEYFIPESKKFTDEEKDELINVIIVKLISKLGIFALKKENMIEIINGRETLDLNNNNNIIRRMQDEAIEILLIIKTDLQNTVLSKKAQVNNNDDREKIIVATFRKQTRKLVNLQAENNDLTTHVNMLSKKVTKLEQKIAKFKILVKMLSDENKKFKEQNNRLIDTAAELSNNQRQQTNKQVEPIETLTQTEHTKHIEPCSNNPATQSVAKSIHPIQIEQTTPNESSKSLLMDAVDNNNSNENTFKKTNSNVEIQNPLFARMYNNAEQTSMEKSNIDTNKYHYSDSSSESNDSSD